MNAIQQLGMKIAYAQLRKRRILEGLSSLNILATKEAALASMVAGRKPLIRVSELLEGAPQEIQHQALMARRAAKPKLLRVDELLQGAPSDVQQAAAAAKIPPKPDLFAPPQGPSPFSGEGPALPPRQPLPATPPPIPGRVGSVEHFIQYANPGTSFEDAQSVAPFVVSRMPGGNIQSSVWKTASLSSMIEAARQGASLQHG